MSRPYFGDQHQPSAAAPMRTTVVGFHPNNSTTSSQPMSIPGSLHATSLPALKLGLFRSPVPPSVRAAQVPASHFSPAPSTASNSADSSTSAHLSPPTAATAASTAAGSVSSVSGAMLISPQHAQGQTTNGSSTYSDAPPAQATSHAHSMPMAIPAFRRAISFVGMNEGFDLLSSEVDNFGGKPHHHQQQQQPQPTKPSVQPRIQNFSGLGQQLRHHFQTTPPAVASASVHPPSSAMQKSGSNVHMSDLDAAADLPELSSPPPNGQLQFAFDAPDVVDELAPQSQASRLDFDNVHISKDQVLGAIPHQVQRHTPPTGNGFLHGSHAGGHATTSSTGQSVFLQQQQTLSRWTPLSSSAPSQLPSFGGTSVSIGGPLGFAPSRPRRDSGSSSVASSAAGVAGRSPGGSKRNSIAFTAQRRAEDVHTPTTIASEEPEGRSSRMDGLLHSGEQEQGWSDPDEDAMSDGTLDATAGITREVHEDGSACSLSSCTSCSGESDDFSANLEDDFDVSLTFQHHGDGSLEDIIRKRLNQTKREHHIQRHMHHRRRRARMQIRQMREEARLHGGDVPLGEGDDAVHPAHPVNAEDLVSVGSYTHGERQQKIQRYLEKRRRRVWSKKILYSCRKSFADKRPRVGGRFVKLKEDSAPDAAAAAAAAASSSGASHGDAPMVHPPQQSFSLSTSPAGLHGVGVHLQHMHGLSRGSHGLHLTGFSLPLSHYAHTPFDFSPSAIPPFAPGVSIQADSSSSLQAPTAAPPQPLSFQKQTEFRPSPVGSGSLAAALGQTNSLQHQSLQQDEGPTHPGQPPTRGSQSAPGPH